MSLFRSIDQLESIPADEHPSVLLQKIEFNVPVSKRSATKKTLAVGRTEAKCLPVDRILVLDPLKNQIYLRPCLSLEDTRKKLAKIEITYQRTQPEYYLQDM